MTNENKELTTERLIYIISHDLRAPLRHIHMFVDLLVDKYKNEDDEESKEWVEHINTSISRVENLLDLLLIFSRVKPENQKITAVDLNEACETALAHLSDLKNESQAVVNIEILPTVQGDLNQLTQLFEQLLKNAMIFSREGVTPAIDIISKESAQDWEIKISDNGVGIEKEYFDKIFQIFERLENKGGLQGNGIGLSLCKKIVGLHKGKIGIDSEVGKGSCFYFTLTKDNKKTVEEEAK